MAERDPIPWKRVAVEAAAIVFSILLAFGIEAWWAARQNRAEEINALRGLLVELEVNRATVDNAAAVHGSRRVAADRLLDISLGQSDATEVAGELAQLLGEATRYALTNYSGGNLSALLASGELSNVRNPEIRSRIAALPSLLENVRENEEQFMANHHHNVVPFVQERIPSLVLTLSATPRAPAVGVEAVGLQIAALLGDDQFEFLLGNLVLLHGPPARRLEELREFLDELMELIRAEVGRESA